MNNMSIDAATQLSQILSFFSEEQIKKIPKEIKKEIKEKSNSSMDTKINRIEDIKEENIFPETRTYLSFIFLHYLATQQEKEEYTKIIKNNEEEYQKMLSKKYSIDKIFEQREKANQEETQEKSDLPIQYQKSFFQFVLDKLKSLFKKRL